VAESHHESAHRVCSSRGVLAQPARVVGALGELPEGEKAFIPGDLRLPACMCRDPSDIGPRVGGPASSVERAIDAESNRASTQLDQAVKCVSDAMRLAGTDMVDQPRPATVGKFNDGSRNVADVDEVAPRVQIADGQVERISAGLREPGSESTERLAHWNSRTNGIEDSRDDHLKGIAFRQPPFRGQPFASPVCVDRVASVRFVYGQACVYHVAQLGGRTRENNANGLFQ
jgi:hypothetical protein